MYMPLFRILISTTTAITLCSCKSVLQTRFNGKYPSDSPCRTGYFKMNIVLENDSNPIVKLTKDLCLLATKYMNCSVTEVDEFISGFPDEFGNYTGLLGMVQRDEIDFIYNLIPLEALKDGVVHIGPVATTGDMTIMSRKLTESTKTIYVTDVIYHFDALVYCYFSISVFIGVMLLSVMSTDIDTIFKSIQKYLKKLLRNSIEFVFKVIGMILDQANYNCNQWPQKILWVFFYLACFLAIQVYLLNLMSSDKVAIVQPNQIDSIQDQLSDEWSTVKPVLPTNIFLYPLVLAAKPGTILHDIYNLLLRSPNESIITFNASDTISASVQFNILLGRLISGENSLFLPNFAMNSLRDVGCMFEPDLMSKAHFAKEAFLSGNLFLFANKRLSNIHKKFIDYRYKTHNEFGMIVGITSAKFTSILTHFGLQRGVNYMACASHSSEAVIEEFKLQLMPLRQMFQVTFLGFAFATLILCAETITVKFRKSFRKWVRRTLSRIKRSIVSFALSVKIYAKLSLLVVRILLSNLRQKLRDRLVRGVRRRNL